MAIEICLSIGLVRDDQLVKLKAAGVDRINHNLNTPRDNYPKITTTHTYQDRLDTLEVLEEIISILVRALFVEWEKRMNS